MLKMRLMLLAERWHGKWIMSERQRMQCISGVNMFWLLVKENPPVFSVYQAFCSTFPEGKDIEKPVCFLPVACARGLQ